METTENIANRNQDDAKGRCPACERTGLPIFLLRQAVIKTQSVLTPDIDPTYQELADYAKTLDFKKRMPDEELKYYSYVLRTLRNGYVYVIQQIEDIESRILHAYECIEGALRLKDYYQLTSTTPRPISKACKNYCHTIPASFIHLQKECTLAWVAYSSQPWNEETINSYLQEQDNHALSRFTKIDVKNFKDSPSQATGNRAVPFKDIFGSSYQDYKNEDSKVLEFRLDNLPNSFESAHPFISLKNEKLKYVTHTSNLYINKTPISCGVVLEDTFGIAEELNSQRQNSLCMFDNEAELPPDEEIKLDDDFDAGFDVDKQNQIFERRAQNMLKMINPKLKKRFKYYRPNVFKKRTILQLIEQYRTSIVTSYDREIEKVKDTIIKHEDPSRTYDYYPLTKDDMKLSELITDKKNALNDFDSCINQKEIGIFNDELKDAYQELVDYCKEWSQDYFTYVRWLFGDKEYQSKYSNITPKSVNMVRFWQAEFDFTNEESIQSHIKDVTQILIDASHFDVKLDEDNALWDELLSNPSSIYYIITHLNINGIDLEQKDFIDINTDTEISWNDVISRSLNIALIPNKLQEDQLKKESGEKQKILTQQQKELEEKIKINQQELDKLEKERKTIPLQDTEKHKQLQRKKRQHTQQIQKLKGQLKNVNTQLSARNPTNSPYSKKLVLAHGYLNDVSLNKYSRLVKDQKLTLIKPQYSEIHFMFRLAQLNVYPLRLDVKIRPTHIEPLVALISQMNRTYYSSEGLTLQEQKFLSQFETDDEKRPVDEKQPAGKKASLKKLRLMMFLPDLEIKNTIESFIKNLENNVLKPQELAKVIKPALKGKVKLEQTKTELETKIEQHKEQKQTTIEEIKQDNRIEKNRQILNQEREKLEQILNQNQQEQIDLDKTTHQAKIEKHRTSVNIAKTGFAINIAVSGIIGVLTLSNIWDNLKQWGTPQAGEGELQLQQQLYTNLLSLGLIGVDLTSQYRDVKLKMQLTKATEAGNSITKIESRLALNNIIIRTVSVAFAAITVIDAIGELKSAFDMVDMEDSIYFKARIFGAFLTMIGAIFLAIATPFTFIAGIVLLIAGAIALIFSKKYDNFTPIQHWLNRCCFGKQGELKYLGYDAYHEEDYNTHSGFGCAINDYMVIVYGINTFIRLKPFQNTIVQTYPAHYITKDSPNSMQRHIYFYVNIAEFAENNPNESLSAHIRLYLNDNIYTDFKYHINTQGIKLIQINESSMQDDYLSTDMEDYINKYDQPKTNSYPIANSTIGKSKSQDFSLQKSPEHDFQELMINKWIAGTIGYCRIKKYQIIIQYNHREEVPLIIMKNGKI
ncbi:toxin VasX [Gilliamella sp. G0441]|uniref:toxin VasX n=1 Tax=Gilliamella sp. G0441 TaxID=3384760 RepID=UPI003D34B0C4